MTCKRTCLNGNFGEIGCSNDQETKFESCNNSPCPTFEACNNFGACSASCGGGTKQCQKQCKNGNIGDVGCETANQLQVESCNNQPCPALQDCSNFSVCSTTCGSGTRTCKRTCLNGNFGEPGCPSNQEIKSESCIRINTPCPTFGTCSNFGTCSATCGGGTKQCAKPCNNGNIGDVGCETGNQFLIVPCNAHPCQSGANPTVQDCTNFDNCSKTCGGGTRTCKRSCINGNFGDNGCPLDQEQKTEACNENNCPVLSDDRCMSDCWEWNDDAAECQVKNDAKCLKLTCEYNAIYLEFSSKLFGITDNQSPSPFTT